MPWGRFVVRAPLDRRAASRSRSWRLLFVPVLNFSTGTPRADALASHRRARARASTSSTDSGIGAGVLSPTTWRSSAGDADATAADRWPASRACAGPSRPTGRRRGAAATPPSSTSSPPRRTPPRPSAAVRDAVDVPARARSWSAGRCRAASTSTRRSTATSSGWSWSILVDHLHPARAGLPLAAAAAEGDHLQRHLDRRRVGLHGGLLAEGPRVGGDLRHRADRRADRLDPADGVRVPLRPLDGLRGLHPQPHARGVRPRRIDRPRRGGRARPHRAAGDGRVADPVPGVHRAGVAARRPTSRCSPPASRSASCSTRRSSAACCCRPSSRVLGRWNWWMPVWAARILRVRAEHARRRRSAARCRSSSTRSASRGAGRREPALEREPASPPPRAQPGEAATASCAGDGGAGEMAEGEQRPRSAPRPRRATARC